MAAMMVRPQQSTSTLSTYSIPQEPGNDVYASGSRDFCNSFWGEGDEGTTVLLTRMRNAIRTSEELQNFWTQRAAIEEEFGKRLGILARMPVGTDETGELKASLQTMVAATHRQAQSHLQLAFKIRQDLIEPVVLFHEKQIERKRSTQVPIEKKLKAKQSQASYVAKAREKYEGDCARIKLYEQQSAHLEGQNLERLQVKLRRTLETVKANEKDYTSFTRGLTDLSAEWETEWKGFCDDCQDLEEERMEFMRDSLWDYANVMSTVCVSDDESCEKIRLSLERLEPDEDLSAFVEAFGTGNRLAGPPASVPNDGQKSSSGSGSPPANRTVHYERISRKPQLIYQNEVVGRSIQNTPDIHVPVVPIAGQGANNVQTDARVSGTNGLTRPADGYSVNIPPPPPPPPIPEEPERRPLRRGMSLRRQSQPLPAVPRGGNHALEPPTPPQPPVPVTEAGNRILFLVKALYDYRATIDDEFDFQAGDIIAVTETPDDGWWSGELLDEARREPGRHIFPSNYVCLF
ncbi:hypothetical protein AX15_004350 [Amanita polypyramis BW_CC]|nr:hypothetical protein AX15_004350 [Amanita polypyramis BW_CC]